VPNVVDERKQRERLFHNETFAHTGREPAARFYSIATRSNELFDRALLERAGPGTRALEMGCGMGDRSIELAKLGFEAHAIDISDYAIQQATERARREGAARAHYATMDAEHLEFAPHSFDRVFGKGILHHLRLERVFAEIARVLKPEGSALFVEPLGHNPLINAYRRRTPDLRTPDEHPLLASDIEDARAFFGEVKATYFHLSTLLALPLVGTPLFEPARAALDAVDRAAFAVLPPARRFAWQVVLQLSRPHAAAGWAPSASSSETLTAIKG